MVSWVLRPGAALNLYVGGGGSDGGALSGDGTVTVSVYEDLRPLAQRRRLWSALEVNKLQVGRYYYLQWQLQTNF